MTEHTEEVTDHQMLVSGLSLLGVALKGNKEDSKRFSSMYGANSATCAVIYHDLQLVDIGDAKISNMNVKNFLMAFCWLCRYQTETNMQLIFKVDSPKTVRKWCWAYARALQALMSTKVSCKLYYAFTIFPILVDPRPHSICFVSYGIVVTLDCFKQYFKKIVWNYCESYPAPVFLLSIDGTHCPIEEQREPDFDSNWYSHKFHGPAVAYELGVNLIESKIEWVSKMFPAGNSDLVIFREGFKSKIPDGMMLVGDQGYLGEDCISVRNRYDTREVKKFKARAKARHETVNKMFKKFHILTERFRNPVDKHKIVFDAVCTIVQYKMELESSLFDI